MGTSDEALLAGLATGDRDASAAFVRRFQRRAYGVARTIVHDSGTAEGVAQLAADEEADGMVLCTEACAAIWEPLTVDAGNPTADDGLSGKVGALERPDGGRQVTFDGRLLYRFVEDPSPGTVTGNGFSDTFEGQPFT